MLANDRYNKILEILERDGSVRTSQLVECLDVSIETVRRDLDYLKKRGLLKKIHGGAIQPHKFDTTNIINYSSRERKNIQEKQEMAKIAVKSINVGDIIALNSSTTNLEIAKLIKDKFDSLTVVTNSLPIAKELANAKEITLILAGGIYNKNEYAFLGEITAKFLSNFSVDKCFISVGGISLKKGVTDFLMGEVLVERKMIEISEETIFLADSSKIEVNSLIKTCDIEENNFIITDSKLDDKVKKDYLKNGIKIINSL